MQNHLNRPLSRANAQICASKSLTNIAEGSNPSLTAPSYNEANVERNVEPEPVGLLAVLAHLMATLAPEGYEDANGFHFGRPQ
jgi:hypothetical protein